MGGRDIVIGAYYALPDGAIALTHGWDTESGKVAYRLDDDHGTRTASEDQVTRGWTLRDDLADFPNSRDPVLPFEFDLEWDAKRRSDLIPLLVDEEHSEDVRAAMARHGIALNEGERERVESLSEAVTFGRM